MPACFATSRKKIAETRYTVFQLKSGGERGIRTPGNFRFNGFQDRRIRPLCHLSGCKIMGLAKYHQINNFLGLKRPEYEVITKIWDLIW